MKPLAKLVSTAIYATAATVPSALMTLYFLSCPPTQAVAVSTGMKAKNRPFCARQKIRAKALKSYKIAIFKDTEAAAMQ